MGEQAANLALKRVTLFRRILGKSQTDFASLMGVSRRTYQRIESGETPLTVAWITRLAHEIGVSPATFLVSQDSIFEYLKNKQKISVSVPLKSNIKNQKDKIVSHFVKQFSLFNERDSEKSEHLMSSVSFDKVKLNNKLADHLNIPEGVIYFSENIEDIGHVMASWERLFLAKKFTRYILSDKYFSLAGKGENKRMLVLLYLDKMDWNSPRVHAGHYELPKDAVLTNKELEEICDKLKEIVGENVVPFHQVTM